MPPPTHPRRDHGIRRGRLAWGRPRGGAGGASVTRMLAAYVARISPDDPLSGLVVGERPEPEVPEGWATGARSRPPASTTTTCGRCAGVGLPAERLPMILGCDAAGLDEDGNEVVVHAVIGDPDFDGDETLDPRRSLLSERFQGTLAEQVVVPAAQPRAQACGAVLRGGRLPADRVADRLPDAVHPVRRCSPATPCWCRAPAAASRRR